MHLGFNHTLLPRALAHALSTSLVRLVPLPLVGLASRRIRVAPRSRRVRRRSSRRGSLRRTRRVDASALR